MDWRDLDPWAVDCLWTLEEEGYEAYPVGGCVRDLLLGRTPGDVDICTSAPPEELLQIFPSAIPTGLRHGTVTVPGERANVEITTFRREGRYSDGRRPDTVAFDVGLTEDLARRDFTINAMALAEDGTVIDPFGCQADLAAGLVRCVGDPDRRFQEDGLRLLRAVRFAAQLGFTLEAGTAAALARNAQMLDRVSGERVKAELEKILLSPRPDLCALAVELGMLSRFGAEARRVDLSGLSALPPAPEERWRGLCQATGLDITALPVERRLRRAVLRPREPEAALSGRDLYDLGLRGGQIGAARRALAQYVAERPEDDVPEILVERLRAWGLLPPEG